jgi:hypothetical protein
MRAYSHYATLSLALLAGTATANAQTVITREIVDQPVETVITRQPTETVITRRPIETVPADETLVSQPYQTVQTVRTVRHISTTHRAAANSRHPVRRVQTRTTRVTRAVLTPAERRTLYRVITRERVVPATTMVERVVTAPAYVPPAYAPPAYVPPPYSEPAYTGRIYTEPGYRVVEPDYPVAAETDAYPDENIIAQTPVVRPAPAPVVVERTVAPRPAMIAVGAPLPATIPIYALPRTAVSEVPASAGYRFAYVNDRVLLVDPATNVVVATLAR